MKMTDLVPALTRCLWVCREMTHPLVSGDRVYSSGLAHALASSGVSVTFVAHEGQGRERDPGGDPVRFVGVQGGTFNDYWIAATSPLPVTAGIQATKSFRKQLDSLLESETFDAIVIDQLGSGWALDRVLQWADSVQATGKPRPLVIYLAHNHETAVWAGMARETTDSGIRKIMVKRNADKVARLEARLVKRSDLVLTITQEDADAFSEMGARIKPTVLTPGYSGVKTSARTIGPDTPRNIVMVGSFKWAPKQENLRQFLAVADQAFADAGIHFDVIGKVPDRLRAELEAKLKACTLHGFVDDVAPLFDSARMAVVPELIGGGFKLKLLDYLFGRLPVATVRAAAAGMPEDIRANMLQADDLQSLVKDIIASIDDVQDLNAKQEAAYLLAEAEYSWLERGQQMKAAIESAMAVGLKSAPAHGG